MSAATSIPRLYADERGFKPEELTAKPIGVLIDHHAAIPGFRMKEITSALLCVNPWKTSFAGVNDE